MLIAVSGCSSRDAKNVSDTEHQAKILAPVTFVGRISGVSENGLSVTVLDPSQVSKQQKPRLTNFIETSSRTRYMKVRIEQAGNLAPRKTSRDGIKKGNIVTVEAKVVLGPKMRIIATKITISPEETDRHKATEIDHSREAVIAGKVEEKTKNGFVLADMNGGQTIVLANDATGTVSGPAGGLLSAADYSEVVSGVQVSVLGERQADGTFRAAQIAVTK